MGCAVCIETFTAFLAGLIGLVNFILMLLIPFFQALIEMGISVLKRTQLIKK